MRTALLTAALVLTTGCAPAPTGADPTADLRAAMAEIAADRPGSAVPHFEAALAALSHETDSTLFRQAVLGKLDALAKHDPTEVCGAFGDALEAAPELFTAADCGKVASSLVDQGEPQVAMELVYALRRHAFPDGPELAQVQADLRARIVAEASPEDSELLRLMY